MKLSEINVKKEKEKQFNQKGINSVEDLLRFFPRSYYDFRQPQSLNTAGMDEPGIFKGVVSRLKNGRGVVYCDVMEEISQTNIRVSWFGKGYLFQQLQGVVGKTVVVGGTLTFNSEYNQYQINTPLVFTEDINKGCGIYPVYSNIKGMSNDYLVSTIEAALSVADRVDKYDAGVLNDFALIGQYNLYQNIHKPKSPEDVRAAKKRLIFEELYDFAYKTEVDYVKSSITSPYRIRTTEKTDAFIDSLPYKLTDDQQSTLQTLINEAKDGQRINALVQGDVGCGKTIVAICLMSAFAENGYQSVLLAPTGVLAEQHYKEVSGYCEKLGLKAGFLVNGLKASERKKILKSIAEGECDIIVGTHSVLSSDVSFQRLGLVVTDEEHRFGVSQREKLTSDGSIHALTMSATPIPRSLGLTVYGKNKTIYTIKTMPNGRKPIKTQIYHNDVLEFEFLKRQIAEGRQAYIVCALKEDKEYKTEAMSEVESVEEIKALADKYMPGVPCEVLTGDTDKAEAEQILARFSGNETKVLIATTVIEVGVNVPNASVIVIRNAERFGLATLHQLRGRVGRGSYQSYCLLDSTDKENERLKVMEETCDGFVIAQKDLEQRGSGDFIGTKQSGDNKCVMLILSYPKYYQNIERYVAGKVRREMGITG